MNTFSIKDSLKFGWNAVKNNPIIVVYFFIAVAVPGALNGLMQAFAGDDTIPTIILGISTNILSLVFSIGMVRIALNVHDGKNVVFENLYQDFKLLIKFFLASILVSLAIIGALIPIGIIFTLILMFMRDHLFLLIIPSVVAFVTIMYLSIRWSMWTYVLVDKNATARESLRMSWNMTAGKVLKIFALYLVQGCVVIVGLLALFVGVFVAIPVASLMMVYVYKRLTSEPNDAAASLT